MKYLFLICFGLLSNIVFAGWENVNTGIDDELTGIVFKGDSGIVTAHKGIYFTTTGGEGPESWKKMDSFIRKSDSVNYSQTKFLHCYYDPKSEHDIVYACGVDTVFHQAIVVAVAFGRGDVSVVYRGRDNSKLNKIGYSSYYDRYFAVGNQGQVVELHYQKSLNISTFSDHDFNAVNFEGSYFTLSDKHSVIRGRTIYAPDRINIHKVEEDVINDFVGDYSFISVGNRVFNSGDGYYRDNFNYGPLNANCIYYNSNHYYFIGTDHGIFRGVTFTEWQPSSNRHSINRITNDVDNNQIIYACGKGGVLLKTTDFGGTPIPFTNIEVIKGGCLDKLTSVFVTYGYSTAAEFYLNDELIQSGTYKNSYNFYFDSVGQYTFKVIGTHGDLADTSVKILNVVNVPEVDKPYTIADSVLCHSEPVDIIIDSTEVNIRYALRRYKSPKSYGHSDVGQGKEVFYTSDSISSTGIFYLEAQSSISPCKASFTDTINIKVEQTKAHFYSDSYNAQTGETVKFYQHCQEAQNYNWSFGSGAALSGSNNPQVQNSFSNSGQPIVELACWSENGCHDTLRTNINTIYEAPGGQERCWNLVNSGKDIAWPRMYYYDISQISPAKNGFFVSGFFHKNTFSSLYGSSFSLPEDSGGYVAKYNNKGVLKWVGYDKQFSTNKQTTSSVVEDSIGNSYICGEEGNLFFDNAGDSVNLQGDGYIIKLSPAGKVLWVVRGHGFYPEKLTLDASGNLVVSATVYVDFHTIPILRNGEEVYTIQTEAGIEYKVLKLSQEGEVYWDFGVAGLTEINDIDTDRNDNLYLTGNYNTAVFFYSNQSVPPYTLTGPSDFGNAAFLAKYNTNGHFIWSVKSTSSDGEFRKDTYVNALVTDDLGNSYITGKNSCSASSPVQSVFNSNGSVTTGRIGNYYVAKVSPEGICKWVQGNTSFDVGVGYQVAESENGIAVVGQANGSNILHFSSASNKTIELPIDTYDYFIANYDTDGIISHVSKNGENTDQVMEYGFPGFFSKGNTFYLARNMKLPWGGNYVNFGSVLPGLDGIDGVITSFADSCGINVYSGNITGGKEVESKKMKIFPNPTKGKLSLENIQLNAAYTGQVLNLLGEVVSTFNCPGADISDLPNGVYLIQVFELGEVVFMEKVVKN